MKQTLIFPLSATVVLFFSSCIANMTGTAGSIIPAQEFSRAVHNGQTENFSMASAVRADRRGMFDPQLMRTSIAQAQEARFHRVGGDKRYLEQGYEFKGGLEPPSPQYSPMVEQKLPAGPPPGSSAPYYSRQMTSNPSLWPDAGQGASLFRDHRAFQPMDIITIIVSETSEGKKKAETDAESKFSLLAGIKEFFGVETKSWAANNTSLDPEALIEAKTELTFEGEGETKRSGSLKARISAVVMEVLPNGLLRVEGTKIVSVNDEEEVMVISGLVRPFDVDGTNQVESSRIANMRIDFYGRGVVQDQQSPGWLVKVFQVVWPF